MKKANFILSILICAVFFASARAQETINFRKFLEDKLAKSQRVITENGKSKVITGIKLSEICDVDNDPIAERVFGDYGAIFVAGNGVVTPNKCVFKNDLEVQLFQASARSKFAELGGIVIELQEPALNALLDAEKEAAEKNLKITPFQDSTSARRSYYDTLRFWNSRFFISLKFWTEKGSISAEDADAVLKMSLTEQVKKVMEYESKGIFFGSNQSKSIFYTIAPTGTSQHLAMLALDIAQYENFELRVILARHGWYQTIQTDYTHFTYLGVEENKLPSLGLKLAFANNQKFWIPNIKQ